MSAQGTQLLRLRPINMEAEEAHHEALARRDLRAYEMTQLTIKRAQEKKQARLEHLQRPTMGRNPDRFAAKAREYLVLYPENIRQVIYLGQQHKLQDLRGGKGERIMEKLYALRDALDKLDAGAAADVRARLVAELLPKP